MAGQVELRLVGEEDLAMLESLTQNPELAGEFECAGWSDLQLPHWRRSPPRSIPY